MIEHTTAVSLMRMALALLDRGGMTVAKCHLEQAIQTASDQHRVDPEAPIISLKLPYRGAQVLKEQTEAAG